MADNKLETVRLLDKMRDKITNGNGKSEPQSLPDLVMARVAAIYARHQKHREPLDKAESEHNALLAEYKRLKEAASSNGDANGNGNGKQSALEIARAVVSDSLDAQAWPKALERSRYKLECVRKIWLDKVRDDLLKEVPELLQMCTEAEQEIGRAFTEAIVAPSQARHYLSQAGSALGDIYQQNANYFAARDQRQQWAREDAKAGVSARL